MNKKLDIFNRRMVNINGDLQERVIYQRHMADDFFGLASGVYSEALGIIDERLDVIASGILSEDFILAGPVKNVSNPHFIYSLDSSIFPDASGTREIGTPAVTWGSGAFNELYVPEITSDVIVHGNVSVEGTITQHNYDEYDVIELNVSGDTKLGDGTDDVIDLVGTIISSSGNILINDDVEVDGKIGIGDDPNNSPYYSDFYIKKDFDDLGGDYICGQYTECNVIADNNDGDSFYGGGISVYIPASNDADQSNNYIEGLFLEARHYGDGDLWGMMGSTIGCQMSAAADPLRAVGNITGLYVWSGGQDGSVVDVLGIDISTGCNSTSCDSGANNVYGVNVGVNVRAYATFDTSADDVYGLNITGGMAEYSTGSVDVTNWYNTYIEDLSKIGASPTLTNLYQLYIEEPTAGSTLNYAIYVEGGESFFGGDVRIDGAGVFEDISTKNITASGNITPGASGIYNIGTITYAFNEAFIDHVYLQGDPASPLEAATKSYVDDNDFWVRIGTVLSPETPGDDITTTGAIIIDSDSNGLYLGDELDGSIVFNGNGLIVQSDGIAAGDYLQLRGGTDGIDFNIGGTEQLTLTDGAFTPTTDNDIDLGDSTHYYKLGFIKGVLQLGDAIYFTQTDGNEYIDSLNDGFMDYGATTTHRFNNDIQVTGNITPEASGTRDLGTVVLAFDEAHIDKVYLEDDPTDILEAATKRYVDTVGATAAGADKQIQFNDGGVFAGDADLTWNKTTEVLSVDANAVFNESGIDKDFRVESANVPSMLFVDGGDDMVIIGNDTPMNSDSSLEIVNDDVTVKFRIGAFTTANLESGRIYFHKSSSGDLGTVQETEDGDYLGSVVCYGADSGDGWAAGAWWRVIQRGAAGANYVGADWIFNTYSSSGENADQFVLVNDGTIAPGGSIIPNASGTLDLGSLAYAFDDAYIDKIYLESDPTTPLMAATKQYVDDQVSSIVESDTLEIVTGRGASTSNIITPNASGIVDLGTVSLAFNDLYADRVNLESDPTTPLQAATKQYVDSVSASGSSTFLGLTDTPAAYTGMAASGVRVNAGADALEFFDISNWDTDNYAVVQVVNVHDGAYTGFVGATAIPRDDTIPQSNEGEELMTLAITPSDSGNILVIEVVAQIAHSNANSEAILALFQDSTVDALSVAESDWSQADYNVGVVLRHYMVAGTTSETTFKVRGGSRENGDLYFNGRSAAVLYGGVFNSSITITELDPRGSVGGGGGASGERLDNSITQVGHSFSVGDILRWDTSGSDYTKAQADTEANAEAIGIVSVVTSSDIFTLAYGGYIEGLSGLTAGTVYYLSDATAGLLTATEPSNSGSISKPLLIAVSTTSGYFFNMRGNVIAGGGGGTTGVVVQQVYSQDGEVAVCTTNLPIDDTIPTWAEGDAILSKAITPTSSTNILRIDVVAALSPSAGEHMSAALFQDGTGTDPAIAAIPVFGDAQHEEEILMFTHHVLAGTTSSTTFTVRAGGASTTIGFNGSWGGTRRFGGVCASSITITEIQA